MSKITLYMDFISGLLLAYDFFPKSGWLATFHDKLRRYLENIDTNKPISIGTLFFNFMVSCFIFLMLLCWAYYKTKNAPDEHILSEMLFYSVGIVIAFIVITGLTIIVMKITHQQIFILYCGVVLALITLFIGGNIHPSINGLSAIIGMIYMFVLLPFAMLMADKVKDVLTANPKKEYHMFAVLGFVIFIVSNLIKINVDP